MTTLWLDLETYCETPIKHGVYRYAEDAEILLFAYAVNDGPVIVEDFTAQGGLPSDYLADMMSRADEVVAHNSMFDRVVLWARGFEIPIEKWRDTRVQAMAHSLPGALEKLCSILNIELDKRKLAEGKQLVRLFCMPRPKNSKIRRATRETHPTEWKQFIDYAGHDVEAMRAIRSKLPTWNYTGRELALWHLDQRINDRGVGVDVELVDAAIRTAEREKQRLALRTQELTGYDAETGQGVASATQRDKLLEHILLEHGVALPDMTADTLERRLEDDELLPAPVRELINVRLQAATASISKYKAILRSVCKDGRLRGMLQFCGALRTGRWSGRLVQPQNLMRTPKYLVAVVEMAAQAIRDGWADTIFGNTMEVLGAGVPWALVAAPGNKIVAPDLSNIEGRVLAWLAGEQWKLDAFRAQDADPDNKLLDLYCLGYAKSFRLPVAEVVADYEAGGTMRQIGKVQELALGYQGAVGAFVSMAAVYRVDLEKMAAAAVLEPEMECKAREAYAWAVEQKRDFGLFERVYMVCWAFTQLWRGANPAIKAFWYELEDAARAVIGNPGLTVTVGRLAFDRVAAWMRIRLPSGRYLCYPSPRVDDAGKISYMGVNQYTRRWQRISTYGGKLAENVTQAIATGAWGILGDRLVAAEAAGYQVVFHVHDELVCEVDDRGAFDLEELSQILTTNPEWADGLPLSAGGYESKRYRKD